MAENTFAPALESGSTSHFKEAVCIEAGRIFDSCSDKDCLEDLQVFFTTEGQEVINNATLIKVKSAEVMDVFLNVEPVPFNKGFYAVDITFYFRIQFSTYTSPVSPSIDVTGLAYHCKKVILFGSEGNVKTFSSDRPTDCTSPIETQLPVATLKCVSPVALGCRIVENCPPYHEPLGNVPGNVARCFEGDLVIQPNSKTALVTLGLFTIVTLERDVQLMIPVYDYSVPEKDCMTSITTEDPCEVFKRIKFPVQEFFPDNFCDAPHKD